MNPRIEAYIRSRWVVRTRSCSGRGVVYDFSFLGEKWMWRRLPWNDSLAGPGGRCGLGREWWVCEHAVRSLQPEFLVLTDSGLWRSQHWAQFVLYGEARGYNALDPDLKLVPGF